MKIDFIAFSPQGEEGVGYVHQLVECFRDVFADPPWNEWLTCKTCGKYWGKDEYSFLVAHKYMCCGEPVVDFWPRHVLIDDILHEITEKTSAYLAIAEGRVIGFCWGYTITLKELAEKLGASFDSLGFPGDMIVTYQDEVGVLMPFRHKKIAKHMVQLRFQDFLKTEATHTFVRTRKLPEPSQTYSWYVQKLGYTTAFEYPDTDGRVVLYTSLEALKQYF